MFRNSFEIWYIILLLCIFRVDCLITFDKDVFDFVYIRQEVEVFKPGYSLNIFVTFDYFLLFPQISLFWFTFYHFVMKCQREDLGVSVVSHSLAIVTR